MTIKITDMEGKENIITGNNLMMEKENTQFEEVIVISEEEYENNLEAFVLLKMRAEKLLNNEDTSMMDMFNFINDFMNLEY
jgi:hypothetical protein